jgi:hypothetical protein
MPEMSQYSSTTNAAEQALQIDFKRYFLKEGAARERRMVCPDRIPEEPSDQGLTAILVPDYNHH